jgi:hypothetical protein
VWLAAALPLAALLASVAAFRWQPDRLADLRSSAIAMRR